MPQPTAYDLGLMTSNLASFTATLGLPDAYDLPLLRKWLAGAKAHANDETADAWDHCLYSPLVQIAGEQLDTIVYCEDAMRRRLAGDQYHNMALLAAQILQMCGYDAAVAAANAAMMRASEHHEV